MKKHLTRRKNGKVKAKHPVTKRVLNKYAHEMIKAGESIRDGRGKVKKQFITNIIVKPPNAQSPFKLNKVAKRKLQERAALKQQQNK